MDTNLDKAITTAASAEATLLADQGNVQNIETSIATATAPLASAQAKLSSDVVAFNAAMDNLSQAALAAKIPDPSAPNPA